MFHATVPAVISKLSNNSARSARPSGRRALLQPLPLAEDRVIHDWEASLEIYLEAAEYAADEGSVEDVAKALCGAVTEVKVGIRRLGGCKAALLGAIAFDLKTIASRVLENDLVSRDEDIRGWCMHTRTVVGLGGPPVTIRREAISG